MKRIMWKYFTANNTNKYIEELHNMVDKYHTAQLSSHPQKLETRRTTNTSLELCMVKLDPHHLQLNSMLEKR